MSFNKFIFATILLFAISFAANGYGNRRDFGPSQTVHSPQTVRGQFLPHQGRGSGSNSNCIDKFRWCRRADNAQFGELAGSKGVFYPGWGWNKADKGVYIFGGYKESLDASSPHIYSNDVYKFDVDTNTFSIVATTGPKPNQKAFHIVSLRGDNLIVALGGTFASDNSAFQSFPEIHSLNLRTKVWSVVEQNNSPVEFRAIDLSTFSLTDLVVGLVASNGFVSGNVLFVFGGIRIADFTFQNDFNVYWTFDFTTGLWTTVDGSNLANFPVGGYDRSCAFDSEKGVFHCYGGERLDFSFPDFSPIYSIPDPIQFEFRVISRTFTTLTGLNFLDGDYELTPRNTGNNMAVISNSGDFKSKTLLYGGDIGGVPTGYNCPATSFLQNNVDDAWVYKSDTRNWFFVEQKVDGGCANALPLNYKRGDSVGYTLNGERYVVLYGGWSYSNTCVQSFNRNAWVAKVTSF